MAFIMTYTDERLTTHEESVWLPMFVAFDHSSMSGKIVFNGYHSLTALVANAPPVGQKAYSVHGDVYLQIVGGPPSEGSTILDVVAQAAYDYAATVLDTVNPSDPEGDMIGFFHDAVEFEL